jgi:uncharacterized protein YeaO (DUF488 family)
MIEALRVYDSPRPKAGAKKSSRYLVERLWPRGMKKESLQLDAWLKDVAPSNDLRHWYGHKLERWPEFRRRYLAELRANFAAQKRPPGRRLVEPGGLAALLEATRRGDVTLLYSARDSEHNSAVVLRDFLMSKLKR